MPDIKTHPKRPRQSRKENRVIKLRGGKAATNTLLKKMTLKPQRRGK